MSRLFTRLLLFSISFPGLSRLYGRLVRIERPRWLIRRAIALFMRRYHITMDEFQGVPDDYRSLGEFFSRPLDPAKSGWRSIPPRHPQAEQRRGAACRRRAASSYRTTTSLRCKSPAGERN